MPKTMCGGHTQNKPNQWFLVGSAAADLKFSGALESDDTD